MPASTSAVASPCSREKGSWRNTTPLTTEITVVRPEKAEVRVGPMMVTERLVSRKASVVQPMPRYQAGGQKAAAGKGQGSDTPVTVPWTPLYTRAQTVKNTAPVRHMK